MEQVRDGIDGTALVIPSREAPRMLPFSEMRALGHTDYSVWFETTEGRIEVTLENVARVDIARLHEEIQGVWARYREGLQDTEEEADVQRARVAALQSKQS